MAKRDIILAEIKKGGATRESLKAAAEVDDKGLSSQLTYLRWMGQCPVMDPETKTFSIVSAEEWEKIKAERGTGASASLSPKERYDKAVKRTARASSALDNAKKRLEANASELNDLQFKKAELELRISELLEGEAYEAHKAAGDDSPEPAETEGEGNSESMEEAGEDNEEEGEFL